MPNFSVDEARKALIATCLNYQGSDLHFELHPEDPYGDAQLEMSAEMIDLAVLDYMRKNGKLAIEFLEGLPKNDGTGEAQAEAPETGRYRAATG